ncbi:MAG: FAD:protein FMN transferase [Pirellulaceae bacterium]|nr:FAD:protein FMN transferase [Pirellulaceae bacterium]
MNRKPDHSTRRQFLTGQSAVDAIGNLGQSVQQKLPTPAGSDSLEGRTYLVQIGRRAMACEFDVYLNAGEHEAATEYAIEALDLIEEIEDQLSVYRHRSEVSRLNLVAATRPVSVDRRLYQLLKSAIQLHKETKGAFDITSGPLIKVWGFYRREGKLPTSDALETARASVGSDYLKLSDDFTVAFRRAGVEINLGGIGKGFALDQCQSLLRERAVEDFMIHGGNSSILASGDRAGSAGSGWTVGIRHPLRPERRIAEIRLRDKSLGTSGTGTQHFYHQGRKYGHIIDPRSGQPAEGVLSTTVVAPRAAIADALSTAFYVMGVDEIRQYCESHPEIGALIICAGKQSGVVDISEFGMDDTAWSQLEN